MALDILRSLAASVLFQRFFSSEARIFTLWGSSPAWRITSLFDKFFPFSLFRMATGKSLFCRTSDSQRMVARSMMLRSSGMFPGRVARYQKHPFGCSFACIGCRRPECWRIQHIDHPGSSRRSGWRQLEKQPLGGCIQSCLENRWLQWYAIRWL